MCYRTGAGGSADEPSSTVPAPQRPSASPRESMIAGSVRPEAQPKRGAGPSLVRATVPASAHRPPGVADAWRRRCMERRG